jgi:hypothetical protein
MSIFKNKQVMAQRATILSGNSSTTTKRLPPFSLNTPRLLNRFSLGCDPEFVLIAKSKEPQASNYQYVTASQVGLRLDEAFGADGSGGPVELRAHPSRFAVEVTASLLNTLRFLYAANPLARGVDAWLAGGYVMKVPIGGHVHFGRKAGVREGEIRSLDALCHALECAMLLPGFYERRERSGYGCFNDYRQQAWGYEYRSFSSWLYHPVVTHLLLTLSKLAVLDPQLWQTFSQLKTTFSPGFVLERLDRALSFYRSLDDDAAIASRGLKFWQPGDVHKDIKKAWGLQGGFCTGETALTPMPLTIPPDHLSLVEIAEQIVSNRTIPFRIPAITWKNELPDAPSGVPVKRLSTSGDFNLGETELLRELFAVDAAKLHVYPNRDSAERHILGLTPSFLGLFTNQEYKRLKEVLASLGVSLKIRYSTANTLEIHIGRRVREHAQLRGIKHLLVSGMFPICLAKHATVEFCNSWKRRLQKSGLI